MLKDKVEVKLLIDGNKYSYEWNYGESFLFDLKEEFPDLLYFSYYLDKEYKNYYKIEPLTDDITLYVKTFKEQKNELIPLHTIYDFDGQRNLGNKIVFTVIGANGSNNVHNNCINLKICRCFDVSNVDECVFYDELMKLDFVEEIYINYHNVEPEGTYCR